MTIGATRKHSPRRLLLPSVIVALTLIAGVIAADRIVDHLTEQRIAASLKDYGAAEVSVEGVPVLTQLAAGELDTVHVTAARARYENLDFTAVDARLFAVPTDPSHPIGTVEAEATIPLATVERLAAEHASLPAGMEFTTSAGDLFLRGSLLGQDVLVGIDPQPEGRRVRVSATTLQLGSAQVDLSLVPAVLTSAISDVVIDLDALPAGLEVTGISAVDDGLRVRVHGTGVMV